LITHFSFHKKYQSIVNNAQAIAVFSGLIIFGGKLPQSTPHSHIINIGHTKGIRYFNSCSIDFKNHSCEFAEIHAIAIIGSLLKIHFTSSGDFFASSFICLKNAFASSGLLSSNNKLSDNFDTFHILIDSVNFLNTFKFIFPKAILDCACVIFSKFLLKSCKALSIPNHIYLFFTHLNVSLKFVAKSIFTL
jgi:hypothetical protein